MTPGIYFTSAVLRHLKVKPASLFCLVALMQSGQPQNTTYLEEQTGFTDKTVKDALDYLQGEGLITRNGRYSWQLSNYATQLPLMAQTGLEPPAGGDEANDLSPIALNGDSPAGRPVAGEDEANDLSPIALNGDSPAGRPVAGEDLGRKNARAEESEILRVGDSDSSSSSRSLIKDSRNLNKDLLPLASGPDPENLRVILAALDEWGIREPARSTIARIPGMTLARIDYHCDKCESRGQAIYRIKNNWPFKDTDEYADPVIIRK